MGPFKASAAFFDVCFDFFDDADGDAVSSCVDIIRAAAVDPYKCEYKAFDSL
jgi:hypothetical protein